MNHITIIGNLTADPTKTYSGETAITKFNVAVQRKYSNNGERAVDFFRVIAFGKLAEVANDYLKKGNKAAVSGSIQFGKYTNKEGVEVQTTDLVASDIEFLTPKGSGESSRANSDRLEPVSDDRLPF